MKKVSLHVGGMSCDLCALTIERVLSELGANGTVNYEQATVMVIYDENSLSPETLIKKINDQGYSCAFPK